jgi:RHS repeat-associated protein
MSARNYFTADVISYSDYHPFGMLMPNRYGDDGESAKYGFQGQENDNEIAGQGNRVNYKYRMHDTRLGRFFATDPLTSNYPWNSPYAFSENRVIDGVELEGLEWENFLTTLSNPGDLKVKLPNTKTAQVPLYTIQLQYNATKSFADFKKEFKNSPESYLSNSKATFNSPVDKDGNAAKFEVGNFIKIDIQGPMNNSWVKINSIDEGKDGSLSATFVTMEGHVEKGIIKFTLSKDKDNNISFSIASMSEVDMALAPEEFAREGQQASWHEVLFNVKKKLGANTILKYKTAVIDRKTENGVKTTTKTIKSTSFASSVAKTTTTTTTTTEPEPESCSSDDDNGCN